MPGIVCGLANSNRYTATLMAASVFLEGAMNSSFEALFSFFK